MIIMTIFDINKTSGQEVSSVIIEVMDTNAAILTSNLLFIFFVWYVLIDLRTMINGAQLFYDNRWGCLFKRLG